MVFIFAGWLHLLGSSCLYQDFRILRMWVILGFVIVGLFSYFVYF